MYKMNISFSTTFWHQRIEEKITIHPQLLNYSSILRANEDKDGIKERKKTGKIGGGEETTVKSSRFHNEGNSKRGTKKNRTLTKTGKEGGRRRLKGYKVNICKKDPSRILFLFQVFL